MTDKPQQEPEDRFLAKYVPAAGTAAAALRREIELCNNDPELLDCIFILGPTGSGKSRLAGIIAAHRCWVEFQKTHRIKGEYVTAPNWEKQENKWLEGRFEQVLD